jgi:hypothetical protein
VYLLSGKNSHIDSQANLVNPSPVPVAAPAQNANQVTTSNESPDQAIVNLEEGEAEFLFRFPTADNWEWFLDQPDKEKDEYHWEVYVDGGSSGDDYNVKIYIPNGDGDSKKTGTLDALVENARRGVEIRKAGEDEFGETVDSEEDSDSVDIAGDSMTITPTVQSNGLKIDLKGDGVKRIFANKPRKVTLWTQRPKQDGEKEEVPLVKYLPN